MTDPKNIPEAPRDERVLEDNMHKLIHHAHTPPELRPEARARIFDALSEAFETHDAQADDALDASTKEGTMRPEHDSTPREPQDATLDPSAASDDDTTASQDDAPTEDDAATDATVDAAADALDDDAPDVIRALDGAPSDPRVSEDDAPRPAADADDASDPRAPAAEVTASEDDDARPAPTPSLGRARSSSGGGASRAARRSKRGASAPVMLRQVGYLAAAVVAFIVLVFGLKMLRPDRDDDAPGEDEAPQEFAEQTHENDAPAPHRVVLSDGSEVVLRAGARFVEVGPRHLRLLEGDLLLDVAPASDDTPGPRRFIVDTPQGDVEVLGTTFMLSATSDLTTATVVRGQVRISNPLGNVVLRAGEEGSLSDDQPPTRRAAPRTSHVTSWARDVADDDGATQAARNGALLAHDPWNPDNEFPLPMRELTVDVHVEDQVARVAINQTFFNTQSQQLEGMYSFPLPADAAIARLAMYVNGGLMEGGIVERQRGRRIYEGIVFQRRDPALLEQLEGNRFQVRIFPLFGRQEKRILLSYTQNIESLYESYRVHVPMPELDTLVGQVRYNVRVVGAAEDGIVSSSHDVTVERDGDDALVSWEASDVALGDDLILTVIPAERDPEAASVAAYEDDDARYLMARVQPDLTQLASLEYTPRQWVILYDTSASIDTTTLAAQRHAVLRMLEVIDEDDEVALVAFDATTRDFPGGFQRAMDLDLDAVGDFLAEASAANVGYTDLAAALADASARFDAPEDVQRHVLYVGDGVVTGPLDAEARTTDALLEALGDDVAFVGVAVGDSYDMTTLRTLARETRGYAAALSLEADLDWHAYDVIATLNTPRLFDLEVTLRDAEGQALELDPLLSRALLADGEQLTILTRYEGSAQPASLDLSGDLLGQDWTASYALSDDRDEAAYLPRTWARARIEALLDGRVELTDDDGERDDDAIEAEITALGMDHFLITPYTSLLVLEDDAMYEEFDVNRGDADGWARYEVPETIEVVSEPLSNTALKTAVVDQAQQLYRLPTPVLQSYIWDPATGQYRYQDYRVDDNGGFGLAKNKGGGEGKSGGFAIGPRGQGQSAGVIDLDATIATDQPMPAGDATKTPSTPKYKDSTSWGVSVSSKDEKKKRSEADALAEEKTLEPMSATESLSSLSGSFGGDVASGEDLLIMGESADGFGGGGAIGGFDSRDRAGNSDYYTSYNSLPYPVRYSYWSDTSLDDLTAFLPAMFTSQLDLTLKAMRARSDAEGTITAKAEAVIDASRDAVGDGLWLLTERDATLTLDAGLFSVTSTTESATEERLTYDGQTLTAAYPEVGLAIARDVTDAEAMLFHTFVPFVLPDAAQLARWFDVSIQDGQLVLVSTSDAATRVEISFDDAQRMTRLVRSVDGEVVFTRDITWEEAAITVRDGDAIVATYEPLIGETPEVVEDAVAYTTVTIPLQPSSAWSAVIEEAEVGSEDWRDAHVQRMASLLAENSAWTVGQDARALLDAELTLTRGEAALASGGFASLGATDRDAIVAGLSEDDPIADYYIELGNLKADSASYTIRPSERAPSLTNMLLSYRSAIASIDYYNSRRDDAFEQLSAFMDVYDYGALLYVGAYQFSSYYRYEAPKNTLELWQRVAELAPSWRYLALYNVGTNYYYEGDYNSAGDAYEEALEIAFETGSTPFFDYNMLYVLSGYYGAGDATVGGRVVKRWSEAAADNPMLALSLFDFVIAMRDYNYYATEPTTIDVDRLLVQLPEESYADPGFARALANKLIQSQRTDLARAVVSAHLEGHDGDPSAGILELASYLAELQGDYVESAAYLEDAMDALQGATINLDEARAFYRRLFGLYRKMALSIAPLDLDFEPTERALQTAAAWRDLDPSNAQIDAMSAELYFSLGEDEAAWRVLSSIIERDPTSGQAYSKVAEELAAEGDMSRAGDLYDLAIEVEPTNPNWLLARARHHAREDEPEEALALLEQIEDGDWQDRFRDVPWQATQLRQELEP